MNAEIAMDTIVPQELPIHLHERRNRATSSDHSGDPAILDAADTGSLADGFDAFIERAKRKRQRLEEPS